MHKSEFYNVIWYVRRFSARYESVLLFCVSSFAAMSLLGTISTSTTSVLESSLLGKVASKYGFFEAGVFYYHQ